MANNNKFSNGHKRRSGQDAGIFEVDECDLLPEHSDVEGPANKIARLSNSPEPNLELLDQVNVTPTNEPAVKEAGCSDTPTEAMEAAEDDNDEDNADAFSSTVITVAFHTPESVEKYRKKFMSFASGFAEFDVSEVENGLVINLNGSPHGGKKKKSRRRGRVKKDVFMLDTNPSHEIRDKLAPLYSANKFKVLEEGAEENKEEVVEKVASVGQSCFNCGGTHTLRDCPVPKNYTKINTARQKFASRQQLKVGRYHVEEKISGKFSHLVPGKISEALRNALRIAPNEAPPYIYKMRALGYPPGWLEEARVIHSNLSLFDMDGKNVKTGSSMPPHSLDLDKIIDYPGFNMPPEKGFRDLYKSYGVPEYSTIFSKERMVSFINGFHADNQKTQENISVVTSTEVSDKSKPSCESVTPIETESESSQDNSLPLGTLEKMKQDILKELKAPMNGATDDSIILLDDTSGSSVILLDNSEADETRLRTPNTSVLSTAFGTPIIKSASPYARLPNPDNFMKDVSPVINFENLPDSTGKYEQMTHVLEKVRKQLKNLNETI